MTSCAEPQPEQRTTTVAQRQRSSISCSTPPPPPLAPHHRRYHYASTRPIKPRRARPPIADKQHPHPHSCTMWPPRTAPPFTPAALMMLFLLLRLCAAMPGSSTNFKISPKPCMGNSYPGTCMFVWECIKSEGQHVGMCMDSFMFGSCCAHNLTENIVMPQHIEYRPTKPLLAHATKYKPSASMTSHLSASGTTTIHRPHGAGTIVIRPSATHRPQPYAYNRPSPAVQHHASAHQHQQPSPPQPQQQQQPHHYHPPPSSMPAMAIVPVIESLLLSSREPPMAISVLDNTIATDLDTAASISTGTWNDPSPTSYWHVTTQPNFITKPKHPQLTHPAPIDKFMSPSTMPSSSSSTSFAPSALPSPSSSLSSLSSTSWMSKPKSTKKPITVLTDDGGSIVVLDNNAYHTYGGGGAGTPTSTTSSSSSSTTTQQKPKPQLYFKPTKPVATTVSTSPSTTTTTKGILNQRPTTGTTTTIRTTSAPATSARPKTNTTTSTSPTTTSAAVKPTRRPTTAHASTTPKVKVTKPTAEKPKRPASTTTSSSSTSSSSTTTTTPSTTSTMAVSTDGALDLTAQTDSLNDIVQVQVKRDTVSAARGYECGVPSMNGRPETRIVGGKNAPFGRWPWQVSVRRTSFFGFSSTHRCGGAVCHCVDDCSGRRSEPEGRLSQVQFHHVRVRFGAGEAGRTAGVYYAHQSDLFAGARRPADWRERNGNGLGTAERRRNVTIAAAGGFGADCEQRSLQNNIPVDRAQRIHSGYFPVRRPRYGRPGSVSGRFGDYFGLHQRVLQSERRAVGVAAAAASTRWWPRTRCRCAKLWRSIVGTCSMRCHADAAQLHGSDSCSICKSKHVCDDGADDDDVCSGESMGRAERSEWPERGSVLCVCARVPVSMVLFFCSAFPLQFTVHTQYSARPLCFYIIFCTIYDGPLYQT